MKLQLSLITIGITTCTLVDSVCASPVSSPDSAVLRKISGLLGRGLSEWGIGSHGGIVSEISRESAYELENTAVAIGLNSFETASPTSTNAPTAETTAPEPTTSSTSWTTTLVTETVYVTVPPSTTNTVAPTQTLIIPERRVKRDVRLQFAAGFAGGDDQISGDIGELDKSIVEMNRLSLVDTIVVGGPCTPIAEFENKTCIGDKVAVCGEQSWIWEIDTSCGIAGLVCGVVEMRDSVHGGWKAEVQCLD